MRGREEKKSTTPLLENIFFLLFDKHFGQLAQW